MGATSYVTKETLSPILEKINTKFGNRYTKDETDAAISAEVGKAYKPKGSIAFASLPALGASVLNFLYNITDSFTTTSDFVEGSGKTYPAGTNVGIINVGTDADPVYKYDTFGSLVDLSNYVDGVSNSASSVVDLAKSNNGKISGQIHLGDGLAKTDGTGGTEYATLGLNADTTNSFEFTAGGALAIKAALLTKIQNSITAEDVPAIDSQDIEDLEALIDDDE